MTNRIPDTNGWIEIKNNPLSKVGVFTYRGSSVMPEADPGQTYAVLRAEEELSDPETVKSARLLPWTNDHPPILLGAEEDGRLPAEEKGIEGVTGEETYYKDGTLYGNIKVFSQDMADEIESGKTELSMGYACQYVREDGEYNGQRYQYRQKGIRFNHLSLVDKGRMGADVAVLDSVDNMETNDMNEEGKEGVGTSDADPKELLKGAIEAFKSGISALEQLGAALGGGEAAPEEGAEPAAENPSTDESPDVEESQAERLTAVANEISEIANEEKEEAGEMSGDMCEEKGTNDGFTFFKRFAKRLAVRDRLAEALKPHIGVFDHAEMDIADVAHYGCKKLGIQAGKGFELPALQGYLQGKQPPRPMAAAMDSAEKGSAVEKYLKGA